MLFLMFFLASHAKAQTSNELSKDYFGISGFGTYKHDLVGDDILSSSTETFPKHNFFGGGKIIASFNIGKRWALRPTAGYSYLTAYSSTRGLALATRHSISFDLLFDFYFKNNVSKFTPYFTFGANVWTDVGKSWRPSPAVGVGAHTFLTNSLSLQYQLKVASVYFWSFVEPSIGVSFHF